MWPTIKVMAIEADSIGAREYSALFCTLGYEQRARYIAEQFGISARSRHSLGFTHNHVFDYQANRDFYRARQNFDAPELSNDEFENVIPDLLRSDLSSEGNYKDRICIDISSLSRLRIAHVISSCCDIGARAWHRSRFHLLRRRVFAAGRRS